MRARLGEEKEGWGFTHTLISIIHVNYVFEIVEDLSWHLSDSNRVFIDIDWVDWWLYSWIYFLTLLSLELSWFGLFYLKELLSGLAVLMLPLLSISVLRWMIEGVISEVVLLRNIHDFLASATSKIPSWSTKNLISKHRVKKFKGIYKTTSSKVLLMGVVHQPIIRRL